MIYNDNEGTEKEVLEMKYKVGDKLRVKGNSKYEKGKYAGAERQVLEIWPHCNYPYKLNVGDGYNRIFHANELEKR